MIAGLEAVETAAADQGLVGAANRKMNRTALLLGDLGDQGEPFVGSGVGVRKGDTEGAVVDVSVVERSGRRFTKSWVVYHSSDD
jgi:hypothetical protein